MSRRAARPWLSALVLLAIAAGLAARWPVRGLWYDETVNAYFAGQPWSALWEWTSEIDNQVPLHFALLKLWGAAAGTSEFALRAFSFFCALLTAAGLIALGARVGGRAATGRWAALAFALAQSFVYAAFEVRPYGLALALAAWSSVLLWDLWAICQRRGVVWSRRSGAHALGYLLVTLSLLYTHYTGFLLVGVQAIYFGWRALRAPFHRRNRLLALLGAGLIVGYLPWLIALSGRDVRAGTAYAGHIPPDDALTAYVEFFAYGQQQVAAFNPPRYAWIAAAAVVAAALFWLAACRGRGAAWGRALFALLLTLLPLAALLVLVYGVQGKLSGRHGWPAWLGAALLLGLGLDALRRAGAAGWIGRALLLGAIALPSAAELHPVYNSYLREAFAYIDEHAAPGDVLILRDGTLFAAAGYYETTLPWLGLPPQRLTDVNRFLFWPDASQALGDFLTAHQAQRVWLLAWQGHIMDPQDLTDGILEAIGTRQPVPRGFGDVSLALYTLNNPLRGLIERVDQLAPQAETPHGGPVYLGGYVLNPQPTQRGTPLLIHTWWQRGAAIMPEMRVSVRLYTPDGAFHAQWDGPPVNLSFGQELWPPGVPVLSRFDQLLVPPDMPPGPCEVRLMIYHMGGAFEPFTVPVDVITIAE